MPYDHNSIEKKWQKYWAENKTFRTINPLSNQGSRSGMETGGLGLQESQSSISSTASQLLSQEDFKPKKYILDMFPYPSGAGLHVGHPKGYTATDIVSRYYHATGHNVLHTMGFDAFGLPAENYAIKTGTHPAVTTAANIEVFTKQLQSLGFSYDWDRMIDTTDPEYYKWTQWIFLELFKRGLAYEQDLPINYCPSCKTGLANEEVTALNACDRCGTRVEKRALRQWVLKITEYADRLIDDLESLDWPDGVKEMQKNWIGKSEGCEFRMSKDISSELKSPLLLDCAKESTENKRNALVWQLVRAKYLSCKNETETMEYYSNVQPASIMVTEGEDDDFDYEIAYETLRKKYPFTLENNLSISVYTTRVDTVFGMTYAVLAPDHPRVYDFITDEQSVECEAYITEAASRSDQDRTNEGKEKTGVFTGSYVINPFNGESVPLWIADYVLGHYGTGAVMAVPAHDERDFSFAKKYNLPIKQSIAPIFEGWSKGEGKSRKDVETLHTRGIAGVLLNKAGDKVLIMNWTHPGNWKSFVTGKTEEGETPFETANREIQEETGYNDFRYLGKQLVRKTDNFHPGKNVNFSSLAYGYLFQLNSEKQDKVSDEEIAKHGVEWVNIADIKDLLTFDDHKILVEHFFENAKAITEDGVLVNSDEYDRLTSVEARRIFTEKAEAEGFGHKKVNYKLRDWLFSRQRYWGEPIPLIHISQDDCKKLPCIQEKDGIPYITLTGDSMPRSNENIRYFHPVSAIIRHWNEDSYMVLTFKNGVKGFVGGSVEEGETDEEAIIREIQEETGYKNIKIEKILLSDVYSRGYKARKNVEEEAREPVYLVHIIDEEYVVLGIEEGIVQTEWVKKDKVAEQITLNHHRFYWDYFYHTDFAYRVQKDDSEYLYVSGKEISKIYEGINSKIIIDSDLPLKLPEVEKYEPAGDGQSPLATVPTFVDIQLADNLVGKRETNTMPQWGGSCWYYLRYMDPQNMKSLARKEYLDYWKNVDEYVGGAEHAVLHLLYARFWHKVLYDIGVVPTIEPFQKLTNVGMILAYAYERADGGLVAVDLVEEKEGKFFEISTGKEVKQVVAKMSKSLKNVVNPNDIVLEYGADTLRLYEMSMSAFTDTAPWNPDAIIGVRRFLDKAYSTFLDKKNLAKDDMKAMKLLHKTIKKVGEDIVGYKFNTAISALMILLNEGVPQDVEFAQEWKEKFLILLHPFAPHMAEELWSIISHSEFISDAQAKEDLNIHIEGQSIYFAIWPEYDEFMLVDDEVTIAIQINGKLRGTLNFLNGVAQEEVSIAAMDNPNIAKWIEGKEIIKEIFIPNKMLSIVVRD